MAGSPPFSKGQRVRLVGIFLEPGCEKWARREGTVTSVPSALCTYVRLDGRKAPELIVNSNLEVVQ